APLFGDCAQHSEAGLAPAQPSVQAAAPIGLGVDLRHVNLRGRQVVLEPLKDEHAEDLRPAASERDLWRYMGIDVASVDDLRDWIRKRQLGNVRGLGALPFLQRDAKTGQAFGSSSLFDIDVANRKLEIGHTWLGASHRRSAANTEAKRLLLGHAFDTMGAIRVQLKCDARNARSRAAIERIGAKPEGILRHWLLLPEGHRRDTAFFSVLEAEWPGVKARLDRMLQERPPTAPAKG
ncbi:MAG: N-acetyltransferase, partial [Thermoplasmata archaeon]|nr:N-acetyltransferase [Thermoplasmata archaeon]